MSILDEDISKAMHEDLARVLSLIEYLYKDVYDALEFPIPLKMLSKFGLGENDFLLAFELLRNLEPTIKTTYEDVDEEVEYFKIQLPGNFKDILSKYQTRSEVIKGNLQIYIDYERGICRNHGKEYICYGVRKNSKRKQLISFLFEEKTTVHLAILARQIEQAENDVLQTIESINSLFKSVLRLNDDLIIRIPGSGFRLNTEVFNFTLK